MAKKKKLESTAPVPLTRGQLSRAEKERRQIRNLYAVGVAVLTVTALIIGIAVAYTFVIRPNSQVASVNGTSINRATYDKLQRWNLFQQIQNQSIQGLSQTTDQQTLTTQLTTLQNQLKNVDNDPVDPTVLSQLIDSEVLRQKSQSELGITVTQGELKSAAIKDFIPQPTPPVTPPSAVTTTATTATTSAATMTTTATTKGTPIPTATLVPTATPTVGSPTVTPSPTATLPPVPGASATAATTYDRYIKAIDMPTSPQVSEPICDSGCPNLSESDYLGLIIEPRVRRDKVTEKLAATQVMTQVEQIHAQHILTTTEEGSKKIRAMLDKGADFSQLANTQSSEQIQRVQQGTAPNGGDLGWFPQKGSNFDQTFVDAAFKVPTGQYSQPVQTQFGWHIIKVIERDPKRPLDSATIDTLKTNAYNDWFTKARDSSNIVPKPTPTPLPATPVPIVLTPAPVAPSTPASTPGSPGVAPTPVSSATPGAASATPAASPSNATPGTPSAR